MTAANGTTGVLADTGYVLVHAEVCYCVLVPAGVPENEAVPIARRAVNRVIWLRDKDCRQEMQSTRGAHTIYLDHSEAGIIFAVLNKDDGGPETWPEPVPLERIAALYGQPLVLHDEE
jgi:hypothetical protein